ncbi:GIY-YIG nuclease family protein [Candidatus Puniceispirillum sp.]|jgi:putative endonuclease|uniref:GIY-YIG nuclease family protein n=1 Tax=Candidatus Puniceispirillum sp. TaxID=2026719 RepID=UPI001ED2848F|nr:GIY-YIG nuclease family protein [Candidatus Puniceispirillum sp.]MBT6566952.1 GIY-YIG nuclease family protein [Candidatus Puniceispirillum sp.]
MQWVVYILKCADNSLYTGITNDLDARIDAHTAGLGAKYTKGRGPFVLIYHETCQDRSHASQREYAIKALPRHAKLALCAICASEQKPE